MISEQCVHSTQQVRRRGRLVEAADAYGCWTGRATCSAVIGPVLPDVCLQLRALCMLDSAEISDGSRALAFTGSRAAVRAMRRWPRSSTPTERQFPGQLNGSIAGIWTLRASKGLPEAISTEVRSRRLCDA